MGKCGGKRGDFFRGDPWQCAIYHKIFIKWTPCIFSVTTLMHANDQLTVIRCISFKKPSSVRHISGEELLMDFQAGLTATEDLRSQKWAAAVQNRQGQTWHSSRFQPAFSASTPSSVLPAEVFPKVKMPVSHFFFLSLSLFCDFLKCYQLQIWKHTHIKTCSFLLKLKCHKETAFMQLWGSGALMGVC